MRDVRIACAEAVTGTRACVCSLAMGAGGNGIACTLVWLRSGRGTRLQEVQGTTQATYASSPPIRGAPLPPIMRTSGEADSGSGLVGKRLEGDQEQPRGAVECSSPGGLQVRADPAG